MKSFYLLLLLLLLPTLLPAQDVEVDDNEYCFRCHSMETLSYTNRETGLIKNLSVIPHEFDNSNHAGFNCIDCHDEELVAFPHPEELREEQIACTDCHSDDPDSELPQFETIESAFEESVHFKATDGEFTCFHCHDPHTFKITARLNENIEETVHYDNQICFDCHGNTEKIAGYTDRVFPALEATHKWLPHQNLHWENVRCIDCHTDANQPGVSHLILPKTQAVQNCVECHSTDSRLTQTLYKFKVQEKRSKQGFFNSVVLNESYVIGATRNEYLNWLSFIIFGAMILALAIHGSLYLKAYKKKEHHPAEKKEYFYPLWLRFWHWLNALLFVALIISGITMQYATANNILMSFNTATSLHNASGILLTLNYLLFFLGNLVTGNYKQYIPVLKGLIERLIKQGRFYLYGIFKNEPHPYESTKESKFNPLQQLTYLKIMYVLLPIIIITGWALLFPETIIEDVFGMSGLFLTAILHTVTGFILSLFMFGHIYLAFTGHTLQSNLKAMTSGWHEVHKEH